MHLISVVMWRIRQQPIGKSIIQWNGEAECLTAEIDAAAFVGQDIAIQRELLRQVLERTAGQLKDIRSVHIGTLRALFYGHAGKKAICLTAFVRNAPIGQ